jgi:type IV secretory pathway VirB2 component (pilin)
VPNSQKFWERLAVGILVIILIALCVGVYRDKVDYTQVIVAAIGLIGLLRGADSFKKMNDKDDDSDKSQT